MVLCVCASVCVVEWMVCIVEWMVCGGEFIVRPSTYLHLLTNHCMGLAAI